MEDQQGGMTAIRMPKKSLGFINSNPRLGKGLGKVVISLTEIKRLVDLSNSKFKQALDGLCIKNFQGLVDSGTEEELKFLLDEVRKSIEQGGSVTINNISREEVEKFKQEVEGEGKTVEITDIVIDEPIGKSKDANPNLN